MIQPSVQFAKLLNNNMLCDGTKCVIDPGHEDSLYE